ncbi:MAG: putative manganese transporter [Candidatus Krumholzibacteria bacterium]|nr:putative manganese transporter [Candidatus Krumholzibacteria bacterium]
MHDVFAETLSITGFVFVMMLVIEYLNVLTSGAWQGKLAGNRWGQYAIAALLGTIPGCLGAFMVVGMYSHRLLSLGAVVAAMIATSGDEAFVMLAMMPRQAVMLSLVLLVVGIIAGALTDAFVRSQDDLCNGLEVHEDLQCRCFSHGQILHQLQVMSPVRGVLVVSLVVFSMAVVGGLVGPAQWNWIRITFLSLSAIALLIVATSPEHFLEQHLWHHVARQHLPRIFAWTLGALLLMHVLTEYLHLEGLIRENPWSVLVIACLVGVIPESGPHLVFLTLYVEGAVPMSILLASSIVQDGHGMLPMLAHSRRDFVQIKLINLVVGLGVGALGLSLGL